MMKDDSFNFNSEMLFPFQFQLLGIIFTLFGVGLLLIFPYFAPISLLIGALILTGYRGIQFERSKKQYREYNSFIFLKFGSWGKYDKVEEIFIVASSTSQKVYTMVTTGRTIKNIEYNAYIKFVDGAKLHLTAKKNKDLLKRKLTKIADFFQIEIVDLSKIN